MNHTSSPRISICIAGKNLIAVEGLRHVIEQYGTQADIYAIPNRNDEGVDRWQPSFLKYARSFTQVKIITLEEAEQIDSLRFFSLEFDRIVKPAKFRTQHLFNIHFSLLPKYKGMYTSAHPLLNGEVESGCTLHRIDQGIDTGEIIASASFSISDSDTAKDLYGKYLRCARQLFLSRCHDLIQGRYQSSPQGTDRSTYYGMDSIDYRNIQIRLRATAFQIHNQIRAFSFRDFQLPVVNGRRIAGTRITRTPSRQAAGSIQNEDGYTLRVASIDYDILLMIDRFEELHSAIREEQTELIRQIVTHNPKLLTETTQEGWTPLMLAAFNGKTASLETLLKLGANANLCNQKGTSPLMYAKSGCEVGHSLDALDILLAHGADTSLQDIHRKNVFDYLADSRSSFRSAIEARLIR